VERDQGRNRSLDGLRGVAVLLVVLAHAATPGFRDGGITGVTLFFALSGFLITSLLLEEYEATGAISFGRFFARRVLRLMPALLAMVLVITAIDLLRGTPTAVGHGAVALTYMTDLVRASGRDAGLLDHTWSLSVEEHFYLLWPPVVPVDDDAVATGPSNDGRREQGEVGEGGSVDDVVAAPVAEEMGQDAATEYKWRRDSAPAASCVQGHPRADCADVDPRDTGVRPPVPLAERQIGHLVPVGGESLGEVAVPALGAADRMREETVVDDTHAHVAWSVAHRARRSWPANAWLNGQRAHGRARRQPAPWQGCGRAG
jgi:hypothetical protein